MSTAVTTCWHCGKECRARPIGVSYCSRGCRRKHNNQAQANAASALAQWWAKASVTEVQMPCRVCSTIYTGLPQTSGLCSDRCSGVQARREREMDGYFVVQVDDEGMFLDEPEWFDFKTEAIKHRDEQQAKYPDREYAAFRYDEVHR